MQLPKQRLDDIRQQVLRQTRKETVMGNYLNIEFEKIMHRNLLVRFLLLFCAIYVMSWLDS